MYISFHGNTCIRLQEKTQSRDITIVIDPYIVDKNPPPGIGAGDLVLATRSDTDIKNVSGEPFLITGPGEYEVKNVMVYGIYHEEDHNTIYRIDADDFRVVHLGLMKKELPDALIESLGEVDVLCVPVGGKDTMTPSEAEKVISKIQPRLVVPMAFAVKGIDETHDAVDPFLRAIGKKDAITEEKYKIAKKGLPDEDMGVVVLKVT